MPLTLPHGGGLYRTRANGADIRYLRAGTGTPVVLLHTLRTQLDMFGSLLQHLDTARAEVIALARPRPRHRLLRAKADPPPDPPGRPAGPG